MYGAGSIKIQRILSLWGGTSSMFNLLPESINVHLIVVCFLSLQWLPKKSDAYFEFGRNSHSITRIAGNLGRLSKKERLDGLVVTI